MSVIKQRNIIPLWLFLNSVMIVVMVVIGGITRLTDSGLSMVDWRLFAGILPPMNENEWGILFENYKLYPEYKFLNFDISLTEFKKIFFWEYIHRIWGRLIGITFVFPFIYFLIYKKLSRKLSKFLFLALFLGCFQGFMGWFMVKSGLIDKPDVSQYRLAAHLGVAFTIYVLLLFLGWNQLRSLSSGNVINKYDFNIKALLVISFFLTFFTIISGAFVAGIDAGLAYNNFPLMGDGFLPPDAFILEPFWVNFFENTSLVQFDHRVFATITALVILGICICNYKKIKDQLIKKLFLTLSSIIIIQYLLGIFVLKLLVPVALGVIHQLGSLIVLTLITLIISEIYTKEKGAI